MMFCENDLCNILYRGINIHCNYHKDNTFRFFIANIIRDSASSRYNCFYFDNNIRYTQLGASP